MASNPRLSHTSMERILHQLKMHPYRVSIVQELKPPNLTRRVTFCHWILHLMCLGHDIAMFDNFFYSDEAWFHLDGFINAQMVFDPKKIHTSTEKVAYTLKN